MNRIVLLLALLLPSVVIHSSAAQAPRREVQWVNSDIAKAPGLSHKILDSKALGHDVGYVVWTPPQFDDSGKTRYPVVYFLHGAGGSEKSDSAGFSSMVAGAIRSGKFPAAICVFPNGGMSGYRAEVEKMIVDELIPLIDNEYPTRAEQSSRVVCGFSMGGAGSVRLSLEHPDLFAAAGSWGGALNWRGRAEDSTMLPVAKQNAGTLKKNNFALLTINGDQDHPEGFDLLKEILTAAEVPHETLVLPETNHNLGKYYNGSKEKTLQFLATHLTESN
ncbi:esterase family protein [Blastopirellula sp. JC732]|uniref:Esterase family protein n=1 Tax=Blastopirellula sediminis TaxID=2894196 RepID=A0A9X1MUD2_9BACT|nr:alpha/beta hydrolase-fold protein [Blastopirellula sediminis]MCC9604926.1 esterase family protein [Blastopirellula sediminis]MCC9631774.1 esterase family protein [Blastopirellula sediminis]